MKDFGLLEKSRHTQLLLFSIPSKLLRIVILIVTGW